MWLCATPGSVPFTDEDCHVIESSENASVWILSKNDFAALFLWHCKILKMVSNMFNLFVFIAITV